MIDKVHAIDPGWIGQRITDSPHRAIPVMIGQHLDAKIRWFALGDTDHYVLNIIIRYRLLQGSQFSIICETQGCVCIFHLTTAYRAVNIVLRQSQRIFRFLAEGLSKPQHQDRRKPCVSFVYDKAGRIFGMDKEKFYFVLDVSVVICYNYFRALGKSWAISSVG